MVAFLEETGGEKSKYCSEKEIISELKKNNITAEAGLDFLHSTGIIERVDNTSEECFPFDKVFLITDSDDTAPLTDGMLSDGVNFCLHKNIKDYKYLKPEKGALIIIYMEEYSSRILKSIYEEYSGVENISFIQAYYIKDEFKIDGFYSPSIGTPCHFCHIGRWRNREKRSFATDKTSWNDVVDFLESKEINIPASISLQKTEKYFSFHILRKKIQSLAGIPSTRVHLDQFCSSITANLIRCEISSEPLPHWNSCDCLTGRW